MKEEYLFKGRGVGKFKHCWIFMKFCKTGEKQQVISHFYKCQANKKNKQMKLGFAWHYNVFNVVLYLFQYQFDVLECFFQNRFPWSLIGIANWINDRCAKPGYVPPPHYFSQFYEL